MPTEKTDISPTYRQKGYEGKTKQAHKRVISNRYRACFVNEYRKKSCKYGLLHKEIGHLFRYILYLNRCPIMSRGSKKDAAVKFRCGLEPAKS